MFIGVCLLLISSPLSSSSSRLLLPGALQRAADTCPLFLLGESAILCSSCSLLPISSFFREVCFEQLVSLMQAPPVDLDLLRVAGLSTGRAVSGQWSGCSIGGSWEMGHLAHCNREFKAIDTGNSVMYMVYEFYRQFIYTLPPRLRTGEPTTGVGLRRSITITM